MAKGKSQITIALRKNQTPQELKLWYNLRARRLGNLKFRRQFRIGKYVVDFCCLSKKLVIELDGSQHNEPNNIIKDQVRQRYIKNQGYKVLRFWNNEIDENLEGVLDEIIYSCGMDS